MPAFTRPRPAAGRRVLFEGAQGTMLDVDHGTYPYVTSSNTMPPRSAPAAASPLTASPRWSASPRRIPRASVAGRSLPSCSDDLGQKLQHDGEEFGDDGRPRRCGWFDAVVARHAVRRTVIPNGLAVTKLDVLTGFKTLRIVPPGFRRQARRRSPGQLDGVTACARSTKSFRPGRASPRRARSRTCRPTRVAT